MEALRIALSEGIRLLNKFGLQSNTQMSSTTKSNEMISSTSMVSEACSSNLNRQRLQTSGPDNLCKPMITPSRRLDPAYLSHLQVDGGQPFVLRLRVGQDVA